MKLKLLFCGRPCEENGKKKASDWEKKFANHIFNKGLISRIHKQLSKLNSVKK